MLRDLAANVRQTAMFLRHTRGGGIGALVGMFVGDHERALPLKGIKMAKALEANADERLEPLLTSIILHLGAAATCRNPPRLEGQWLHGDLSPTQVSSRLDELVQELQRYVDEIAKPRAPTQAEVDAAAAVASDPAPEQPLSEDGPEVDSGDSPLVEVTPSVIGSVPSGVDHATSRSARPAETHAASQAPKLSLEARAIAALVDRPEATMEEIAGKAGCSRQHLYELQRFMQARELLREQARRKLPRGKIEAGRQEAWKDEEDDEEDADDGVESQT